MIDSKYRLAKTKSYQSHHVSSYDKVKGHLRRGEAVNTNSWLGSCFAERDSGDLVVHRLTTGLCFLWKEKACGRFETKYSFHKNSQNLSWSPGFGLALQGG